MLRSDWRKSKRDSVSKVCSFFFYFIFFFYLCPLGESFRYCILDSFHSFASTS